MRTLFAAVLVLGLTACAPAADRATDTDRASLKVGDPTPPVKATKWGRPELKEYAAGKVYVVEFWATWCGPCIVMMPHMGELQNQYKGKATFIGFTAKDKEEDGSNNLESVTKFVEKRQPKLGYTF